MTQPGGIHYSALRPEQGSMGMDARRPFAAWMHVSKPVAGGRMNHLLVPHRLNSPKKSQKLPPPYRGSRALTRQERVDLLADRLAQGFALWNPDDRLDPDEMSKEGFGGAPRESNGTDKPPEVTTMDAIADAIAARAEARKAAA